MGVESSDTGGILRSQRPTAGPRIEVGSHVFEVGVAGAASSTLDLAWLLWFLLISPAFMANLTAKKANRQPPPSVAIFPIKLPVCLVFGFFHHLFSVAISPISANFRPVAGRKPLLAE